MSYYYDDDSENTRTTASRSKAVLILIISLMAFTVMVCFGISLYNKSLDNKLQIETSLPAGQPKIVLTQDLAKEHMVTYLNNRRAMLPVMIAIMLIVVMVIIGFVILNNRIVRRSAYPSGRRRFTIIAIIAVVMIFIAMGVMIANTLVETADPESQTPRITTATVVYKDYEVKKTGRSHTRYYYLTYSTGERDQVSESVYNKVTEGRTYYFGHTERNKIFAVYDTNVYTLENN